MRVNKATASKVGSTTKHNRTTGSNDFSTFIKEHSNTNEIHSVDNVSHVESLIALQEIEGEPKKKKQRFKYASQLVDELENYRIELLKGELSEQNLSKLELLLQQSKEHSEDYRLEALIDDIETRVAVEIAKLEKLKTC